MPLTKAQEAARAARGSSYAGNAGRSEEMRKTYWLVAYGHVTRWAGPCATESEAIQEAYGLPPRLQDRAAAVPCKNPKYMSQTVSAALHDAVAAKLAAKLAGAAR